MVDVDVAVLTVPVVGGKELSFVGDVLALVDGTVAKFPKTETEFVLA